MNSYAIFLRGVNISGRNKLPMADFKKELENLSFVMVKTFLSSGNIILDSAFDKSATKSMIEKLLFERFGLLVPIIVIDSSKLLAIDENKPSFANKEGYYHNVIFIIDELGPFELLEELGSCSKEEEVEIFDEFIYWSYDLKCYQKCNYWKKAAQVPINEKVTIRTLNTINKMASYLRNK